MAIDSFAPIAPLSGPPPNANSGSQAPPLGSPSGPQSVSSGVLARQGPELRDAKGLVDVRELGRFANEYRSEGPQGSLALSQSRDGHALFGRVTSNDPMRPGSFDYKISRMADGRTQIQFNADVSDSRDQFGSFRRQEALIVTDKPVKIDFPNGFPVINGKTYDMNTVRREFFPNMLNDVNR